MVAVHKGEEWTKEKVKGKYAKNFASFPSASKNYLLHIIWSVINKSNAIFPLVFNKKKVPL
jgi:hypothetical protein